MDETELPEIPPVGEQLRAAREKQGLSLEDLASQTRIPRRHLENLEAGDWSQLPAPTYTLGFAKSYAGAVGLDRTEIGDQLRAEMGGYRPESTTQDVFQPADPARAMPKGLVIGALVAVVVLFLIFSWLHNRSLAPAPEGAPAAATTQTPAPQQQPAQAQPQPQTVQAANGPVVLTATDQSWIQITDNGKTLFEGLLQPGQTYQVPPTAIAPKLKAGKPETLKITVGNAVAPPVGPPGKVAANVSLLGPDLMKGPAAATVGAQPPATAAPAPAAPPPPATAPSNQATQ
jgi:cytoskeletal protein RodZ